ncbi:unnamed protein product [Symbiodinium sp. CCMP2456]|nr:unnamed protein product [Symbiodinium sp. CCMP2456]
MATLPAPPSVGAAAAISLLGGNPGTFAATAPAVPVTPAPPPTRDDDVLGAVMAKAGAPSAPPLPPTAPPSISADVANTHAKTADGHLVRIEQSRNDASVLEGFLRKAGFASQGFTFAAFCLGQHAPDSAVEGERRKRRPEKCSTCHEPCRAV